MIVKTVIRDQVAWRGGHGTDTVFRCNALGWRKTQRRFRNMWHPRKRIQFLNEVGLIAVVRSIYGHREVFFTK